MTFPDTALCIAAKLLSLSFFLTVCGCASSQQAADLSDVSGRSDATEQSPAVAATDPDMVAGDLITFSAVEDFPNAAWCWFQDPRAIVDTSPPGGPRLLVSTVSARDRTDEIGMDARGDNDLYVMDLSTREIERVKLHRGLSQDDHNVAALYQREDGRYLAVYADHHRENQSYWRISEPDDPLTWSEPGRFDSPEPVTYSNLFEADPKAGDPVLLNFRRTIGFDPNLMVSDDEGSSWAYGGRLLEGDGRPYVQYAQGNGMVHFIATDQHPRDADNSVYHGMTDGVAIYDSFGAVIDADLIEAPATLPHELTRLHDGAPDSVGWSVDIEIDDTGNPVAVFSVQKDGAAFKGQHGRPGLDHRYHYARFDGKKWQVSEMAFAGTALYPFEEDYTGLAAIAPDDPSTVVISTNAHPVTGTPLISTADGQRHWELFRGTTDDHGKTWSWTPVTANSTVDNLRPVIPQWDGGQALLWMRGSYSTWREWDTQLVGLIDY